MGEGTEKRPEPARDQGIQALRGIAVILMVAGHVIGDTGAAGLQVSDDSVWRLSYEALEDLRMPLFAVLSGFVYAVRPVTTPAGLKGLVTGKVRRLLVPLMVVGVAFAAVQLVAPGVNARPEVGDLLPRVFLYGYGHLWFLQAIFLVFVATGLLDAFGVLRGLRAWLAVTVAAVALYVVVRIPDEAAVFSINGALRLFPFFLLGYGAHRFGSRLMHRRIVVTAVAAFVLVYGLRLCTILDDVEIPAMAFRLLRIVVGILGVLVLLAARQHLHVRPLAWLGGFSFAIYLLHVFGSAGIRVVAHGLGMDDTVLLFALGMCAALAFPVAFELLLGRWALISWGVLGQRPRRRRSRFAPVESKAPTGDAVT